ncbi:hypothetical protein ACS0TY_001568 [Phlomoides rotata]
MEQSEFDTITTRVRHLRENITKLQKNYDQLTLNVKVSGYVQQVNLDNVQTSINGVGFQNHERTNSAYTSSSSKLEENKTENQELKPDVSNHAGGITVHGKTYSNDQDSGQNILSLMYLVNIRDFGNSKEQIPLMLTDVHESRHNNPHLKRGEELEIKFISIASEDTTNEIKYPSFHFMKPQRLDKRAFTYIKQQEMKPALVVNLTEDEISVRRAWGVWICLTEMDKVKYPFKIYQNLVNESFSLNTMTGGTIRFANDAFKQKRTMIWENS